jgi:hypothetical protein
MERTLSIRETARPVRMIAPKSDRLADDPSRWSCLGFEVRSGLSFRFLRRRRGALSTSSITRGRAVVTGDPLMSWEARSGNPYARRIYIA